jgi:hypothetical protein
MRHLIEYSTGFFTGSSATDYRVVHSFAGEEYCGVRMSLIHSLPKDVTVFITKDGVTGTVNLERHCRKKCKAGMIKGFVKAVVLVTDPYEWLLERAAFILKKEHGLDYFSKRNNNSSGILYYFEDAVLRASREFDPLTHLYGYKSVAAVPGTLPQKNFILVSFAALLSRDMLTNVLNSVSSLIGLKPSEARLRCAHTFVDMEHYQKIAEITQWFMSRPSLLCEAKKVLDHHMPAGEMFQFRLFANYNCTNVPTGDREKLSIAQKR